MGAASFKSLYQKRPVWQHADAQGCVAGRSRYSTKTSRYLRMALGTSRLFPGFCSRGSRESHSVMHWRLDGRRRSGEDWIEASP
jgi:hypothetical protein